MGISESMEIRDAFHVALEMGRKLPNENGGLTGFGIIERRNGDGVLDLVVPFANLITDKGDEYCARKLAVGIGTPNAGAPTAANGMKLGISSTAASKASAGAALVSYTTGSNALFTATHPTITVGATTLGTTIDYKCDWIANVATATITEAVIVNDAGSNATSTAANTYARTTGFSVPKNAGDSLAITWSWKQLGA
jgi:hypothetical protein